MKNSRNLIVTILISGLAVLISYAINFILTPYITENVGTEAYGYVSLAKTAVSYAGIITVALSTYTVRFISLQYHQKNYKQASEYYSSSIVAAIVISLLILFVAGAGIYKLELILNIPIELINSVKILFLLTFINFSFTTITTPFTAACYIKNRLTISGIIKIIAYFIDAITLWCLFGAFTTNVWYIGIGMIVATLTILLGNIYTKKRLTPEICFDNNLVSISKVKDLMFNGIWQSINSLGTVLNSGLDLLITNQMLSALAMGQLSIAKTIGSMFSVLYSTISQPFQPRMLKIYASGNKDEFLKELKFAMIFCGYFSAVAFAGFVVLGKKYYELWIPNQNINLIYTLTIVTILSSVADGIVFPLYYVNTLTMKKKVPCLVTIGSGVLNVLFMFILIKKTNLGVYSVVWTTAILMLITNLFFNPIYCAVTINEKWYTFYPTIMRHILSCIIMIITFFSIEKVISSNSWIGLIFSAFIMAGSAIFIHIFVMCNKEEKCLVKNLIKNKILYR